MIPKDKELKLIALYMYICDLYDSILKYSCQRYSNNSKVEITDQEIMTIYLFAASQQAYYSIKSIHTFAKEYLLSWFPKLPSYQTFNDRINRLNDAFRLLCEHLFVQYLPSDVDLGVSIVDSLPIITCKGKNRIGKIAPELTGKGYCSSKDMYYYGMKLHACNYRVPHKIPFPEYIMLTSAEVNDLTAFKQSVGNELFNRIVYGDKIYIDEQYFSEKENSNNYCMLTPIKLVKGESDIIRKMDKAYNDLFSKAVSAIRQPIESFFNWLIEKTNIQNASKVRAAKGLLLHVFGKLTAAFIHLIF